MRKMHIVQLDKIAHCASCFIVSFSLRSLARKRLITNCKNVAKDIS